MLTGIEMQREYELIAILRENAPVDDATKGVKQILERHGAQGIKEESWGRKNLNYERDDQGVANVQFYKCKLEPTAIQEINRELKIEPTVLQHMVKVIG